MSQSEEAFKAILISRPTSEKCTLPEFGMSLSQTAVVPLSIFRVAVRQLLPWLDYNVNDTRHKVSGGIAWAFCPKFSSGK